MGEALPEVQVPWKPIDWLAPGAMVALYDRFEAVTVSSFCVKVAFHPWVTNWSPGKVKPSDQPLIGAVPLFVIVPWAVTPPGRLRGAWVPLQLGGVGWMTPRWAGATATGFVPPLWYTFTVRSGPSARQLAPGSPSWRVTVAVAPAAIE